MANADFPNYTDPSSPHDDAAPGTTPWRDANGVWHFGGTEGHGGGAPGSVMAPGSSAPATTPPAVVTPPSTTPTAPNGFNLGDFLTTLTGGVLSGLGGLLGQQHRQSFSGTEADPVQALAGVQRRISGASDTLSSRTNSTPTLTAPSVQRNTMASTQPTSADLEHLQQTLRMMGRG